MKFRATVKEKQISYFLYSIKCIAERSDVLRFYDENNKRMKIRKEKEKSWGAWHHLKL